MNIRFTNASRLRKTIRDITVLAVAAGGPIAMMFSCGGSTTNDTGPCKASPPSVAPTCTSYSVPLTGDLRTCGFNDSGFASGPTCNTLCGSSTSQCELSDASTAICNNYCQVDGRRPEGLAELERPTDLASSFASLAYFEAASVDAFATLRHELRHHGAPVALMSALHRAQEDEVRHAAMARRAALSLGATPMLPTVADHGVRSLEAIAIENAREGCVRETFGALVGEWQSVHAPVAWIREHYATLARDESRHAALSWRLHAWLMSQLSDDACRRVTAELERAIDGLMSSLLDPAPSVPELGLPSATQARTLAAALFFEARAAA